MAWVAANLFVQIDEQDALVDALLPLLNDDTLLADAEGLLDDPPPIVISALREGWLVIAGLRGWIADPPELARRLSQDVGHVVSSEVIGHFFRLRHAVFHRGEERAMTLAPKSGWDRATTGQMAKMPLYRDVEQLAYALLLDLKIPRELVLTGTRPTHLDKTATKKLEGALTIRRVEKELVRKETTLETTTYAGDLAPLMVKEVGRDFGLSLYYDRFVEGLPSDESVDRLIQLEDKIAARATELFGKPAKLHVTYFTGEFQEELDRLLMARGRDVPVRPNRPSAIPWWQFWRHFGRFK